MLNEKVRKTGKEIKLHRQTPHWNKERKIRYLDEAGFILSELADGNEYLARRLEGKIGEYGRYINGYKR